MKLFIKILPVACLLPILSACTTTPPPVEEVVVPPVEQTCYSVASLKKVVVPAVTKSGYSVTSIENPPEYIYDEATGKTTVIQNPPIERKEPWTKVIEPERIYYTTEEGEVITDICELNEATEMVTEPEETTEADSEDGKAVATFRVIPDTSK